jgi:hypothetical protein
LTLTCNKKSILYSKNIYYCKKSVFVQKNNSESDNYHNIFDKIIRKIYGNDTSIYNVTKIIKNIKLLLKDDYKTQRVFMNLSKIYVK